MLIAIQFDDQRSFATGEINNEALDRKLPNKLESVEATVAKIAPKPHLGIGLILAKAPGCLKDGRHHAPSPAASRHPLPDGARGWRSRLLHRVCETPASNGY